MKIAGPSLGINAPIILIAVMAISLTTFLLSGKFIATWDTLEDSRIELVVNDLKSTLETGLDLGLQLGELENAQAAINFEAAADPAIASISLYGENGEIVFHTGPALATPAIPHQWKSQTQPHWRMLDGDGLIVAHSLHTAGGANAGSMILRYSRLQRDMIIDTLTSSLRSASAVVITLTALVAFACMFLIMRRANQRMRHIDAAGIRQLHRRVTRQLFATVLLVLLVSQLAMSVFSWSRIEEHIRPQLEQKATIVSSHVTHEIGRALNAGVPLARLEGVSARLDEIRKANTDIASIRIVDMRERLLFSSSADAVDTAYPLPNTGMPILLDGTKVARLQIGIDTQALAKQSNDLLYDIAVVLLTSMLIAFEVLLFVIARNISQPMLAHIDMIDIASLEAPGERESHVNAVGQNRIITVRILIFLFLFAEILSRPFMPLFAETFRDTPTLVHSSLLASLPISVFLLSVALTMPFAGRWSDRVGRRRSYIAGAIIMALGLLLTSMAPLFFLLLIGRLQTGIGFGLMFMACQGYIADHAHAQRRSQGAAMFVSAIMVAEVCGPAVGGLLADRIGFRPVFLFGAGVALLAAYVGAQVLDHQGRQALQKQRADPLRLRELLLDKRFAALCMLSGVPAKMMYAGFLVYLVPVVLTEFGNSKAEIGRFVMLYGVLILALAPVFSRLADRFAIHARLVGLGGMLTSLGLLMLVLRPGEATVLLGIAALGIGQSMSLTAQFSLVTHLSTTRAARTGADASGINGVFRMLERLGSTAGAALAGAMMAIVGSIGATLVLGAIGMISSILFLLVFSTQRKRRPA
jgi:predicted MFS family arabinose efflux permease